MTAIMPLSVGRRDGRRHLVTFVDIYRIAFAIALEITPIVTIPARYWRGSGPGDLSVGSHVPFMLS
jgi:hypothetical protein